MSLSPGIKSKLADYAFLYFIVCCSNVTACVVYLFWSALPKPVLSKKNKINNNHSLQRRETSGAKIESSSVFFLQFWGSYNKQVAGHSPAVTRAWSLIKKAAVASVKSLYSACIELNHDMELLLLLYSPNNMTLCPSRSSPSLPTVLTRHLSQMWGQDWIKGGWDQVQDPYCIQGQYSY